MRKILLFFIMLGSMIFGLGKAQAANPVLEAEAIVTSAGVQINWGLSSPPTTDCKVIIYPDGSTKQITEKNIGRSQSDTSTVKGKAGDRFTVTIKTLGKVQIATTTVTATDASSSASSSATSTSVTPSPGSSGGAYTFTGTLFGDVSAPEYMLKFYYWAVGIAVVGASIMIIFAGYKYTLSRGNPSEISNAKEIIISSLVGLALLLLSFTILRFLGINVVRP